MLSPSGVPSPPPPGDTSSAVSQQIAALERDLQIQLFERETRGIRLTSTGRDLIEKAEPVVAMLMAFEDEINLRRQGRSGRARIATFPTASQQLVIGGMESLMTEILNDVNAAKDAAESPPEHVPDLDDGLVSSAQPSVEELEIARELVRTARARGVGLTGPDGMLKALTKTVIETALDEEMAEHLGYGKHDPLGRNSGNSRNGVRTTTVLTDDVGPIEITVPRDRDGTFTPVIVGKRQRRLGDADTIVLSLSARG